MESFLALIVVAVVIWLVVKNANKNTGPQSSTPQSPTPQNPADARPKPDFTFKGQQFISLREASNKGGDYGMKFTLAIFKKRRVIEFSLRVRKEWTTVDITFDAIEEVRRVVLNAGEYGTYPAHLIVITTDGEGFPLREIILYPGEYRLLDALNDALKSKASSEPEDDLHDTEHGTLGDRKESSSDIDKGSVDKLTIEEIPLIEGLVSDGALQAIVHLAERSPDRALAMIDRQVVQNGEQLALRCARLTALRRLVMGPPRSVRGTSHDVKLSELRDRVRDLSALRRALAEIAEIEHEDKDFFVSRPTFEEELVDNVCTLADRLEPGVVQETLGWTKLLYFGVDRLGYMSEEIIGERAVGKMPRGSYSKILRVRFRPPKTIRSANSMFGAADSESNGWKIDYTVFGRVKDSRERTVGDAVRFRGRLGELELWEDGSWVFKPSDDGERYVGGGPMFEEESSIDDTQ